MSKKEESLFKSPLYFDLSQAAQEIGLATGATDTLLATGTLAAKTVSNTAVLAGKIGLEIFKRVPDAIEKNSKRELETNKSLSPIEIAKHEESLARVAEFKRKQEEIKNRHKKN
jgi:1-aminocyclopropane-1-carboxylate deaminase/D-cysteine desulfhydrase-like pyridoxal-dependent ACC family enzyme